MNNKMKRKYINLIGLVTFFLSLSACQNDVFIDEMYVDPEASFSIGSKQNFDVFETVNFKNEGEGQKFVVWPGDFSHVYGKSGNNGLACNGDGSFSYAYQEPGVYNAVWIATSIKANGEIASSIDSIKITVLAQNGGLSSFSITRIARMNDYGSTFFYESYGKFVSDKNIICPMPYQLWTTSAIKRTVGVKFSLNSNLAKLNWKLTEGDVLLTSESATKVFRFDKDLKLVPQTIAVQNTAGDETNYDVMAMVIPEFTQFSINGIEGVRTRDLSAFNKFNIVIDLPDNTNLTTLTPSFVVFNNDANLIDSQRTIVVKVANTNQVSNVTSNSFVNPVKYVISYAVNIGGYTYNYDSEYSISVK